MFKYAPNKSADSLLENPNDVNSLLAMPIVFANFVKPNEFTAVLYLIIAAANSVNLTPVNVVKFANDSNPLLNPSILSIMDIPDAFNLSYVFKFS